MLTPLQVAGLVGCNLLLLLLAFLAFRLIAGDPNRRGVTGRRRSAALPDELFTFDSWSDQGRTPRPMSDGRRTATDGR